MGFKMFCGGLRNRCFFALKAIIKNINSLMLLLAFGLVFSFAVKNWDINVKDPYVLIGCFLILIAIPIISRFDVVEYMGVKISRRSIEQDIAPASKGEVQREKIEDLKSVQIASGVENTTAQEARDERRKRIEERRTIEERILGAYSHPSFRREVKLHLDEPDPVADIDHLLFDGSYQERKRRYFIITRSYLSPFLIDRVYRYLRIIKDISDKIYHHKIILKIAYIQTGEEQRGLEHFRRFFRNALDSGYLEIDMFDADGNKL